MNNKSVLPQFLSHEHQNSQSFQRTADAAEQQAAEIAVVRRELQKTREEFADYKRQQADQREADRAQAGIDKKKQFRHELFVAAFTVAFTLFLEHLGDVVKLAQLAFEALITLAK